MNPIICDQVWKKYTKGEKIYSLRDAVPDLVSKIFFGKNGKEKELSAQEFWALKDVSFTVKKGEVLGIIGPNGAGKSTTLKLLSRIIKPNRGTFKVNGRLSALIEITAGFHPDFTGRENVYFNGAILGMSRREIDAKFDQIVEFSGVSEFIDTPVKRYSSGMYARLGFSVAAHVNPDVLLVDEVLAVGDMTFQAKCAQKMRDLLNSGTTIILVSHNIPLVQSLCSRVLLLDHGQVLKEGSAEDVIPYYQNLIFEKAENELKKKTIIPDCHIHLTDKLQVEVTKVNLCDQREEIKENFSGDDTIKIEIQYEAINAIEDPILTLSIVRADGVVCCSTNTKDAASVIPALKGVGKATVNLGQLHLAAGVYYVSIGIWDKEMVHPFVIRRKDVFRVVVDKLSLNTNAVFVPKASWKLINNGRESNADGRE